MNKIIWTRLPGLVPYKEALQLQEGMVASRLQARKMLAADHGLSTEQRNHLKLLSETDMLLFLQHAPVYTAGRRTSAENFEGHQNEEERLKGFGADYMVTKRGGLTTYHGPGQLMAYPILDLAAMKMSSRCYVDNLQQSIRNVLSRFDIPTIKSDNVGAFVTPTSKIASIGVHIRRHLTSHGYVLNVDNQCIPWFNNITACGLDGVRPTSIQQEKSNREGGNLNDGVLKMPMTVDEVIPIAAEEFGKQFNRIMVEQVIEEEPEVQ